jgi:anti-sigma regulatory factor (Ser/Thr protein kinase)
VVTVTATEDVAWYPVENPSAPGQVRRAVTALAHRLGFDEHRRSEVGVAATELATNLHRHAVAGTVAVRIRRTDATAGVELVAIDAGPGIADLGVVMADGHSTAGTLGVGLGAVRRLATRCEAFSAVDHGTIVIASFWPDTSSGTSTSTPPRTPPRTPPAATLVEGITRPINGETVCGDAWACRLDGDVTTVLLADGLGHGPLAATASQRAVAAFAASAAGEPDQLLALADRALGGTRGAAVSVARIDTAAGTVRFAGVGNVTGWIDDGTKRRQMVTHPGIVGQNRRKTIRQLDYELPPESLVVLHSDGLSGKWTLDRYPTIRRHDPLVIAASLIRDAGIHHDDASVVVARAA